MTASWHGYIKVIGTNRVHLNPWPYYKKTFHPSHCILTACNASECQWQESAWFYCFLLEWPYWYKAKQSAVLSPTPCFDFQPVTGIESARWVKEWLSYEAEMRSYLYNTESLYYKNLNKDKNWLKEDRRWVERHHLFLLLAKTFLFEERLNVTMCLFLFKKYKHRKNSYLSKLTDLLLQLLRL